MRTLLAYIAFSRSIGSSSDLACLLYSSASSVLASDLQLHIAPFCRIVIVVVRCITVGFLVRFYAPSTFRSPPSPFLPAAMVGNWPWGPKPHPPVRIRHWRCEELSPFWRENWWSFSTTEESLRTPEAPPKPTIRGLEELFKAPEAAFVPSPPPTPEPEHLSTMAGIQVVFEREPKAATPPPPAPAVRFELPEPMEPSTKKHLLPRPSMDLRKIASRLSLKGNGDKKRLNALEKELERTRSLEEKLAKSRAKRDQIMGEMMNERHQNHPSLDHIPIRGRRWGHESSIILNPSADELSVWSGNRKRGREETETGGDGAGDDHDDGKEDANPRKILKTQRSGKFVHIENASSRTEHLSAHRLAHVATPTAREKRKGRIFDSGSRSARRTSSSTTTEATPVSSPSSSEDSIPPVPRVPSRYRRQVPRVQRPKGGEEGVTAEKHGEQAWEGWDDDVF